MQRFKHLVPFVRQSSLFISSVRNELFNRPFPCSVVPLFQSESKCDAILMKMKLHAELIFI